MIDLYFSCWLIYLIVNFASDYFRTVGTVIVGVAFIKLLSMLCSIIRRQLQMVPWHIEVVTDCDPRVHPVDPHRVRRFSLSFSDDLRYIYH